MAISLMTRTSSSSTPGRACFPWPTLARTPTEASSSCARSRRPGWTASTSSSEGVSTLAAPPGSAQAPGAAPCMASTVPGGKLMHRVCCARCAVIEGMDVVYKVEVRCRLQIPAILTSLTARAHCRTVGRARRAPPLGPRSVPTQPLCAPPAPAAPRCRPRVARAASPRASSASGTAASCRWMAPWVSRGGTRGHRRVELPAWICRARERGRRWCRPASREPLAGGSTATE
jgi:hypothetical protein